MRAFVDRHIGPNEEEIQKMTKAIGVSDVEELIGQTIPENIRLKSPLDLPEAISEMAFGKEIEALGKQNKIYDSCIGLGYHAAITPAVIQRNILENPGWYTAYTPYQAEIAQGRMEALLNFQTLVCDLTGMELANASLLDEATSAAEAMTMLFASRSRQQKKDNAQKFFVHEQILPQTLEVLKTRATPLEIELVLGENPSDIWDSSFFGAIFQYPGKSGRIIDLKSVIEEAQSLDIKTVVAADILALTVLESPGALGADVVVGSTQRLGIPLGYGGPHAAYFATRTSYKRNIPGRIIGQTKDLDGKAALRMALQTREQHIKRDRATSNICTAQVLLAVMAGMYGVYHGPKGLKAIATQIHRQAQTTNNWLSSLEIQQENETFFDTLHLKVNAKRLKEIAEAEQINFFYPDTESASIAFNETNDDAFMIRLRTVLEKYAGQSVATEQSSGTSNLPQSLERQTPFMEHPVFHRYQSETALMRYIKQLERKDLALNHSMIALGSCTMKLNAASEMLPLSHAQWNQIHPFVPVEQAAGYQTLISRLEEQLNKVTGFAATSLQPNSGAQGEYAGLMVIRAYHQANGDHHRNICLIPASAHGTNPASAVMAGMKVVVVGTDTDGNIDWEDLQQKAIEHKDQLAALMITYPSTHGVFESKIQDITHLIHENGGQVYMDGANMNAQVGLTSPAIIGADVCHLNLHKTFAIPHGGGGPGVGPICVAAHLSAFLPGNPVINTGGEKSITSISAAPWGSALACIISYGYIRMLGAEGLQRATEIAILNANYMKARLEEVYPVLYVGDQGRSAHELILDCRPFKTSGIEVVDIAKRLMDYGFHAPTVSFPVGGTMMLEPTESEQKAELDRFCDALIAICMEIKSDAEEDLALLKNAPHTQNLLTADKWDFPYSRKKAAFPLDFVQENKFWPTVRRVDEAFGDRNLVCSCNPIESYQDAENV